MTLHIFNPEHDIALASGLSNFTAPHAARQLRHDLGWLPAVWCSDGDCVLVDDVDYSQSAWQRFRTNARLRGQCRVTFVNRHQLRSLPLTAVDPWGWNSALKALLLRAGVADFILPSDNWLELARQQSSRRLAAQMLPLLRVPGTVGQSFVCTSESQTEQFLQHYGHIVLKAPWSSSGRGLRYLDVGRQPLATHQRWLANIISQQGAVMVEPFYHKVKDFGMEFIAHPEGTVQVLGLSLFDTKNGAYTGNIVATEAAKRAIIARYLPLTLIDQTAQLIATHARHLLRSYTGPFGVDMMVVAAPGGFILHPCVEINLRRTMGHVAIGLMPWLNASADDDIQYVMRLEQNSCYQLKIRKP